MEQERLSGLCPKMTELWQSQGSRLSMWESFHAPTRLTMEDTLAGTWKVSLWAHRCLSPQASRQGLQNWPNWEEAKGASGATGPRHKDFPV